MLIYRTVKRATCRQEGKVLLYKKKKSGGTSPTQSRQRLPGGRGLVRSTVRCYVITSAKLEFPRRMTRPRRERILSLSLSVNLLPIYIWYSYFSKASRHRTWMGNGMEWNGMGIRGRLEKPHLQLTVRIRSSWDILKSYYITRWDCSDNKEFLTLAGKRDASEYTKRWIH